MVNTDKQKARKQCKKGGLFLYTRATEEMRTLRKEIDDEMRTRWKLRCEPYTLVQTKANQF